MYKIEIDGRQFNCGRMSAEKQFEISHLLGNHRILLMANTKDNVAAIMTALMSINLNDARRISDAVLGKAMVAGTETPVKYLTFHDDVTGYWRLVAELIVENFQKLSSYLREESLKRQAGLAKKA